MSNNLDLPIVLENQDNKEATLNTANGYVDAAITEFLAVSLTSGNVTLTDEEFRRHLSFKANPGSTSGRKLTLPAIKGLKLVTNVGTAEITVVRGTTELPVPAAQTYLVYTDGTTNGLVGAGGGGGGGGGAELPEFTGNALKFLRLNSAGDALEFSNLSTEYEVGTSSAGVMVNNETLMTQVFTKNVNFPSGMTGSQAKASVAATGSTTLTVRKNGTSIGTIVFAASGVTGTFTGFSASSFAPGDLLAITGPATADTTLSGLAIALVGSIA